MLAAVAERNAYTPALENFDLSRRRSRTLPGYSSMIKYPERILTVTLRFV